MRNLFALKSKTVIAVMQILLYLHAALWIVFAIITAFRASQSGEAAIGSSWFNSLLMALNAVLFGWSGYQIPRRKVGVYLLALVLLFINVFTTVTDQLGAMDMLVLVTALTALVLLMIKRKSFLPVTGEDDEANKE